MNLIKEELINKIIEELKNEKVENIAFIIAPFSEGLDDEDYKEFLEDLKDKTYWLHYNKPDKDDYYSNGTISVSLQSKVPNEYNDYWLDYNYEISLDIDERNWGYCECSDGDKDYDSRHGCCGHGCDWTAPAFSLVKHINIGNSSWNGDAHDFWDFEDKFYNIDNKQLEEDKKQAKIKYIQEQIEYYTKQLENVKIS